MDNNYKNIRKIINDFISKNYFTQYGSSDIFYFETLKGKRSIMTFMDNFYGEFYGLQLFYTNEGLNYIHDLFSYDDPMFITVGDCDSICLALIPKDKLEPEDIKYLRENKVNIKEDNNIIIYRFKRGFGRKFANYNELAILFDKLNILGSILQNEKKSIKEAFEKELCVISVVDTVNYLYTNFYKPCPILEHMPKSNYINQEFIDEYKNKPKKEDELYVLSAYLPIILEEDLIRPLLITFYYPFTNKVSINSFMDKPTDYKNVIWSMLDEVFTNNGVPARIIFSNRYLYAIALKTLSKLNIEVLYDIKIQDASEEDNSLAKNNLQDIISEIYTQTNDEIMTSKEAGNIIIDAYKKVINGITSELDIESSDKTTNLIS